MLNQVPPKRTLDLRSEKCMGFGMVSCGEFIPKCLMEQGYSFEFHQWMRTAVADEGNFWDKFRPCRHQRHVLIVYRDEELCDVRWEIVAEPSPNVNLSQDRLILGLKGPDGHFLTGGDPLEDRNAPPKPGGWPWRVVPDP